MWQEGKEKRGGDIGGRERGREKKLRKGTHREEGYGEEGEER